MRYLTYATIVGGLVLAGGLVRGSGARSDELAQAAISTDRATADEAIAQLRAEGSEGLERLWTAYREAIDAHRVGGAACGLPDRTSPWSRIRAALDGVGGQRDCYTSKLYWYTNLDEAQAAARASGKPILSLRTLGKLTDEYSCANSRFFRTALYANAAIADVLRRDYVLHWQAVRSVPVLTVDFGDGRVLRRTITGNSIHYVLDAQGRIVDALPGLYGPKAFLETLGKAYVVAKATANLYGHARQESVAEYYRRRSNEITDDARAKGIGPGALQFESPAGFAKPRAVAAAALATPKNAVEFRALRVVDDVRLDDMLAPRSDVRLAPLASALAGSSKLDASSLALIRAQSPASFADNSEAIAAKFERDMAMDTARNEYVLHRQLYAWLLDGAEQAGLDALNEWVYAELFLTPLSDPWMGLANPGVYTALEDDGRMVPQGTAEFARLAE